MEEWQKRANHEYHMNESLALCGNKWVAEPDMREWNPGLIKTTRFQASVFWSSFNNLGHDRSDFSQCKCSTGD